MAGALVFALARAMGADGRGVLSTHSDVTRSLRPPLTLGMARVVLRPGATTQSTTQGVRIIVVESGVVAVGLPRIEHGPVTAADLSLAPPAQQDLVEVIMATGTSLTVDDPGTMSLRNPGAGSAVILDVVVYRATPRPFSRAFTNDDISFQMFASALAETAPVDGATVRLERQWLASGQRLEQSAGAGVLVTYLERGAVQVTGGAGQVLTGRAAAAAPYSQQGALQVLSQGKERLLTAGGTIVVTHGGRSLLQNAERRDATMLVLQVLAA